MKTPKPKDTKPVESWQTMFKAINETVVHGEALERVIDGHVRRYNEFSDAGFITQAMYHKEAARTNKMMLNKCQAHLKTLTKFLKNTPVAE